jgi:para-aminobenzoate synthetase component 1
VALLSREVRRALPPRLLLEGLGDGAGVRLLEAGGPEGWGSLPGAPGPLRSLLGANPDAEFRGGLASLQEALAWLGADADRPGHEQLLIGHVAYELGWELDRLAAPTKSPPNTPEVCLGGYRAVYVFDPLRGEARIVGSDLRAVRRLEARIREAAQSGPPRALVDLPSARPRSSDREYLDSVRAIQAWIRAGDVYQVNLARRLDMEPVPRASLPRVFAALSSLAPAPFGAYLDSGDHAVLSNSPERFLRVVGRHVETCPIKGTRPRGRTPEEDSWLAKDLAGSPKDRAEHVMIVDLERNDLGRVCETGSVRVARLAALRSYPTVHHLVSSVQGVLRGTADHSALLRATFPGGSITGAPKLRAMEIIDSLEPVARGVYTGAIGRIDAAGGMDLSIAIRTAVAEGERLSLHVGGGIVADSDPEAELQETRDKAAAFARLCSARG